MNFLLIFAHVWQRRFLILAPVFLFAVVALLWSFGHRADYRARTVLNIGGAQVQSPVLQNVSDVHHLALLKQTLTDDRVLEDTLIETGLLLEGVSDGEKSQKMSSFARQLSLSSVGKGLLRLEYMSKDPQNIEHILEVLTFNFINEILAPERFRIQQQLGALEEQVKRYNSRKKMSERQSTAVREQPLPAESKGQQARIEQEVALEFDVQRLEAQRKLAQQEYDLLLARAKSFFSAYDRDNPTSVTWFVESPRLVPAEPELTQHMRAVKAGASFGLVIGLLFLILGRLTDRTLRTDRAFYATLGQDANILGHLPHLGSILVESGKMSIDMPAQR